MQLLNITLYHVDGRRRTVDFNPGELNIVTGESRTGKSALLLIVDFCLGNDKAKVPVGPIKDSVAWFGTLWQLDSGARLFLGRPAHRPRVKESSRAMIEIGGAGLEAPRFEDLVENTDSASLRAQVGKRIGIPEQKIEPGSRSGRTPFTISLGHAALLNFQGQDEIASRSLLFHRQGEDGISQAIRDTLPFFLGAAQSDQATLRAQLRDANRELRRADADLISAENAARLLDVSLQALLEEASAAGLTDVSKTADARETITILSRIRHADTKVKSKASDVRGQDGRRELETRQQLLRSELETVLANRGLLLDGRDGENDYDKSLGLQAGRLASLELLRAQSSGAHGTCPLCNRELGEPDPTVELLSGRLQALREELVDHQAEQPLRREALQKLDEEASELRAALQAVDRALESLQSIQKSSGSLNDAENQEFIRGRIDATLSKTPFADDTTLANLRSARLLAQSRVEALETELSGDDSQQQLISRLIAISRDMSTYAKRLGLEHSELGVRLDLSALTVIADSESGPTELSGIGSAANWIGYHLVAHLALHRFFVRQNRPVPRLLMIDQPSQAYYSSPDRIRTGQPADTDREAVGAMFKLMKEVAAELAPEMQIIVIDHANLDEPWFAESVRHNWRGEKLIPIDWIR